MPTEPTKSGIDRRSMIKKAAIAGGAAWVAPVVIGSIASPAGAVTAAAGCYRMWTVLQGASWSAWQATDPGASYEACSPNASECTETDSITYASCVSLPTPVPADDSGDEVTIAVGGCNCVIAAASATIQQGSSVDTCRSRDTNGTSGATTFGGLGTKTATINPSTSSGDEWDNSGTQRSTIGIVLYCT